MNENFLNNIVELLNNSERLEDMGRNSLIASGYAQQRADEASINLIELLKTYRNKMLLKMFRTPEFWYKKYYIKITNHTSLSIFYFVDFCR